jgi:hypothetical protein
MTIKKVWCVVLCVSAIISIHGADLYAHEDSSRVHGILQDVQQAQLNVREVMKEVFQQVDRWHKWKIGMIIGGITAAVVAIPIIALTSVYETLFVTLTTIASRAKSKDGVAQSAGMSILGLVPGMAITVITGACFIGAARAGAKQRVAEINAYRDEKLKNALVSYIAKIKKLDQVASQVVTLQDKVLLRALCEEDKKLKHDWHVAGCNGCFADLELLKRLSAAKVGRGNKAL